MADWLIRHFGIQESDLSSAGARERLGAASSIICIICNVALCLAKGAIGVIAGSVSIVADAVNNLSDASSNIVSLLGFKLAGRPADDEHPYGHGRYEYLASLVVAALIIVVGIELIRSSIDKIANPTPTEFNVAVVLVLALSIAVKFWMMKFNGSLGARIASPVLQATSVDSRNDVITTSAVLIAAVVSYFAGFDLDGWAGIGVGCFIAWSGFDLVRSTVSMLLGQTPDPALVSHIYEKVMSYPGVMGTHDLMIHDYGPGRQFVSAHVEMAAEINPIESHDVIDAIEEDLKSEGLITVLHYDPIVTKDGEAASARMLIDGEVKAIDPCLTIHDVRLTAGPVHADIAFDCVRPSGLDMTDDDLRQAIVGRVGALYPESTCTVTIDSSYVSAQ